MAVFLEYYVHLTDEALVATLQATRFRKTIFGFSFYLGETGHPIMSPNDAAAEWDAPIQESDAYSPKVGPPNTTSDYFTSEFNYPRNVAAFKRRKSGFWGFVIGLFGAGLTQFYWRATFIYAGPAIGQSPVPGETLAAMPQRRWLDGFELPDRGEMAPPAVNPTGVGPRLSRGASRHISGFGWSVDQAIGERTHRPTDTGLAVTNALWERFYVRPRRFGLTPTRMWRCTATIAAAEGIVLELLPTGQIAVSNVNAVAVQTLIGSTTAPLVVHAWHKIDLRYNYALAGGDQDFRLYVNGAEVFHAITPLGLGTIQNIASSVLGANAANTATIDYDDWIGADPPSATLASKDWNAGSRVVLIGADAFASDHGAWVGDWRSLRQRTSGDAAPQVLTSITSGARLSIATDAAREIDQCPNGRGIAALMVGLNALRAGVANGTLGYKLPGGADVMAAITQTTLMAWNSVYHLPTGLFEPLTPLAGLELKHDKGAAVDSSSVQSLFAIAEVIGLFGPEDTVALTAAQLGTPGAVAARGATGSAQLVADIKAGLVARGISLSGACGAFEITKRVAWALKSGGGGLLEKLTGNKCQDRSVDIVAFQGVGETRIFDMLIDGGAANGPTWSEGTPVAANRWKAPTDPGDTAPPPAWDAAKAYIVGDTVLVAGREYRCLLAHTNQTPPNPTFWAEEGPPLGDGSGLPTSVPPHTGIHNAPYPRTPWARGQTAPLSPVVHHTGTYVGTGTFIDLFFRCPIHFLFIRPASGGLGGAVWWSAMVNAHRAGVESFIPSLAEILVDPSFAGPAAEGDQETRCVVHIAGAHADLNAVGITYSYLAIADPGMRFCHAGALHIAQSTLDYVNPLDNEGFTPEALFTQHEVYGAGATNRIGFKGIGHAATAMSMQLNGIAETASALSFSNGTLTLKPGLFTGGAPDAQIAFLAFRRDDGSGDVGIPRALQLATYVGDGNASRTISLAPASGRRPMWALVVPHNAVAAMWRDPSHTDTTSGLWGSSTPNAATGITAGGIDQFTVGLLLNANTIVYDVFVIPGDTAACNNGWSCAGEFPPVEPGVPGGPGWPEEPSDPETPGPAAPGPGTEPGGDDTDFGTDCVDASTKIINQALARLGIGKRVDDIVDEQTEEAATARLLYSDDVSATLRDFPWPFATRYAQLVYVAGSEAAPINGDWTYAYRAPANMMFARRLVRRAGAQRRFDPSPLDFRVGSDAIGPLIYTNHAEAGLVTPTALTVELEYTIRLTCAASAGDAIFRSALAWRHAHSLAPILSRDEQKVVMCWQMYQHILGTASTKAAQETQHAPDGDADWIAGRN